MRNRIISTLIKYLIFFLVASFITTCSILLYMEMLMDSLGQEFTQMEIEKASKLTFLSIFLIALFFTILDLVIEFITIDIPTKRIKNCLSSLTSGDYSARIKRRKKVVTTIFDEISDDINRLSEELGGVEMLRSDFISSVSHEIKTPLSAIQNYAMLLSSPGLEEEKRMEYASIIGENSRRLARMTTDILRLNRLENQNVYPQRGEYDLSEEICSSLLSFEDIWSRKNINLITEIAQGIKSLGDKELMALVWNNIFSNAFKFTPENGEVSITLKLYGDKAMVTVTDSGCGMDPYTLRHLWDKFYKKDHSNAKEGNGLGLSLVKRVIAICNGEIDVKSEEGKGSTFLITLPSSWESKETALPDDV